MRTRRVLTMLPTEWRPRCRGNASPHSTKSWWRLYVDLLEEGFTPCLGSWTEQQEARRNMCCGGGRELIALELIGGQGELVMYRTFAVCPRCRDWIDI